MGPKSGVLLGSQSARKKSKPEVDTSAESVESVEGEAEQCESDKEATGTKKGKGVGKGASNKPFLHNFAKDLAKVHEAAVQKVVEKENDLV